MVAARDVPYRVTLYGADHVFVQEVNGTFDMPPGVRVPIYISGIASGKQNVTQAFLEIEAPNDSRWFALAADPRVMPVVSNALSRGALDAPRIEAVLSNPSTIALNGVHVVVLVSGSAKDVIAASQTIVDIPAQGQATATFTWRDSFSGVPVSIEVVPIVPLPDR